MIPLFEPVVPVFDVHGDCIARIEYDNDPFEPYVVHLNGCDQPAERYGTLVQAERAARKMNQAPKAPPSAEAEPQPKGAPKEPTTTEAQPNPNTGLSTLLFADGFEQAFVGIGTQFNTFVAVYDLKKAIAVLVEKGMAYDEALEYLEFNVLDAYVGPQTPVFLDRMSEEEARERAKEW